MKTPRFWKTIERHALSAEYRDIEGEAWGRFLEGVRKHGIINGRKIILYEGKILDGWQLQRACLALGIVPLYEILTNGMDPRAFVEIVNDERRHETQEEVAKRIEERRQRVAAARLEGKSLRTIAEEVEVSQATVRNDLEVVSTAQGCAVEPLDGKITGKDEKQRPATMPPKILCTRCQRVGETKDCEGCGEARKPKPATPAEPANLSKPSIAGKPKFDETKFEKAYGPLVRLVDERGNAMGKGPNFKRCHELLGEFIKAYSAWKKETARATVAE
jgi:hypothetical protein